MAKSTSSSGVIPFSRVEGTAVFNPQGEELGSIEDLLIDKASGQVRYAVLEFGGFLGMGTDRYPLPWTVLKYDTSLEGYVVPIDKSTLAQGPSYPDGTAPEYTEAYGRKVYDYYGASWN